MFTQELKNQKIFMYTRYMYTNNLFLAFDSGWSNGQGDS